MKFQVFIYYFFYFMLIQAKQAGSKETIRRGALMKMLLVTAQTLPLWISKPGQQPPPLCGAIPADPSYVAKVRPYTALISYL